MPSGVPLNDTISSHFTVPSPGAVNDKLRAFFDQWYFGEGSPEGVVTAPTGSLYLQKNGTTQVVWQKQSGSGNTGWGALGTGTTEQVDTLTFSGGTFTVTDVTVATIHSVTLTANVSSAVTFPAAAAGKSFLLRVAQDATGSRTFASDKWPATVKWPGGVAPVVTQTASKFDVFAFTCVDGTNWIASTVGQSYT